MERRQPTVVTEQIDRTIGWKAHRELLRIIEEKKGSGGIDECLRKRTCCPLNDQVPTGTTRS